MPEGGLVCRKCRTGLCAEGETWCRFCSSAGALSELAITRFTFAAHRGLAEEACFQAARLVRGLVDLDKATNSQVTSLNDRLDNANRRLKEVTVNIEKTATPKSSASRARESGAVKEEERGERPKEPEADFGSEESYEESEEVKDPEDRTRPVAPELPPPPPPPREERPSRDERPPEPEHPPRRTEDRDQSRSRSRNRGRRGGERHQQQFRSLNDPYFADPPRKPKKKKRKNRSHRPRGDGRSYHRR